MRKMQSGDFIGGNKIDMMRNMIDFQGEELFYKKKIYYYRKVGVVMKIFKSRKLPKDFKIIC